LIKTVDESFADYDPTKAARAIQTFVDENLSNWYVRLCRRRFWKGEYSHDKIAAYQTLFECLNTLSKLIAPIAPYYADRLYSDLQKATNFEASESVHLSDFPLVKNDIVNKDLEQTMELAQNLSSMILSLRKKESLKVRQPLQKVMVPVLDPVFKRQLQHVEELILSEVNVKELQYLEENDSTKLVKQIKPNFKNLGRKAGPLMKQVAAKVGEFGPKEIEIIESEGRVELSLGNESF